MTDEYRIKEGDKVTVYFLPTSRGQDSMYGTVRHIPQATGECWIIEGEWEGINYVQTFSHIRRA